MTWVLNSQTRNPNRPSLKYSRGGSGPLWKWNEAFCLPTNGGGRSIYMRYFSMFSGIGGFELGIRRAYSRLCRDGQADIWLSEGQEAIDGAGDDSPQAERPNRCTLKSAYPECVGFSEIDKYAIKIYEHHFGGHKNYGDATKIDAGTIPDFDLLVGGFPCQAFSIAGKRLGFEDTRGTLFFDIARILKVKRPRMFLLENVKGLLSHDNGRTFKTIITTLAELGYGVEWQVLNSKDFGVPQNRERVFIVGHLGEFGGREVFPIGSIDEAPILEDREASGEGQRLRGQDISAAVDANYHKGAGSTRQMIQASEGLRIRRLTPTECERLQGYPDGWTAVSGTSDSQRYKTLGNSVTVNVIEAVVREMLVSDQMRDLV